MLRWLNFTLSLLRRVPTATQTAAGDDAQAAPLAPHLALGQRGEQLARAHLERIGYRIVALNFRLPIGRNLRGVLISAEVDVVAYEGTTLCFVEVKTRRSDWFATPEQNVDLRKQRQISRAARVYRRMFNLEAEPYRFDVVSVVLSPDVDTDGSAPMPRIELLRNFWADEKFRRKRPWFDTR